MKMDKLKQNLVYSKFYIGIVIIGLLFISCEEKPKKTVKKPVKKMVNIVKKIIDKNTTLSKTIENDGIVVHGARDEELLDAFGLAVSQAIVEDGVSVPDCTALEKTGYLTKDECEEITNKYFGFYDLNKDGSAKKIGDIFKNGIAGDSIKIKNSDISYFDSSGNPLLENQVEFDEVVASSNDLDFLKKLKEKIPSNNKEMLNNINKKISFLNDVQEQSLIEAVREAKKKLKPQNIELNDLNEEMDLSDDTQNNSDANNIKGKYSAALENLKRLKNKHDLTKMSLSQNENDQSLIDKYNNEEIEIANLEQEIEMYASQMEN